MVYKKVTEIIAGHLEIDRESIQPESDIKDLGADSLAVIDILMDIEQEFDADIPEKKIGTAVGDIVSFLQTSTPELERKTA